MTPQASEQPTQHAPEPRAAPEYRNPVEIELETLIRARYPLISIISWEETRVMKSLARIGSRYSKIVMQWTINGGLTRYRGAIPGTSEGKKGTKDPILALREIDTMKVEPTIFVLKDFHRFMDQAGVVRGLRDLANSMHDTYSTLVILSPVMKVPSELEKDLTVVDFPLPDREELSRLFDEIATEARKNPDLEIEDTEDARRQLLDATLGLTATEVENVFAKILLRRGRLGSAEAPEVYKEKRQIVRKSGLLEYIDAEDNIEDIGGLNNLKNWLDRRQYAFHPAARRFGLPMPKGLMLLGVQGCGKSLAAKAVSQYWRMPLLRLDMGRLFGSLVGSSEDNVRRAIKLSETIAPTILWIDEIEKGFSGLQSSGATDSGTTSRVFATLLTWFQEKTAPVFVIATANNIEQLPPELMRQGRFDEIFFVDLPTREEREEILRIHLNKRRRDPARFDLGKLAEASEIKTTINGAEKRFAFSGAELEQAVISGLYDAFYDKQDINQEILLRAIQKTSPLSMVMAEEIDHRRRWAKGRTRPAS